MPYEQKLLPHQQKDITIKNLDISFVKLYPYRNTLEVTVSMPYNNLLPLAYFLFRYKCSLSNHISESVIFLLFSIMVINFFWGPTSIFTIIFNVTLNPFFQFFLPRFEVFRRFFNKLNSVEWNYLLVNTSCMLWILN